jgi:predicted adenine nucleotide alpha hydrolase (AANH) superfamily ATPase
MKRLALHVCCGICAIPALALLKKREVAVTGIFFNPNIDSRREYTRRQDIASRYFKEQGLDFYGFPYEPRDFLDALGGCAQKPQRCRACWDLRIAKTASFADAGGFDLFSTTLLSSPYQDVSIIREVAETRSGKSIFSARISEAVLRRDITRRSRAGGIFRIIADVFIAKKNETQKRKRLLRHHDG